MANANITSTLGIAVDGATLPEDLMALVAGVWVDDNLHLPDMFTLRFRDPDRLVLPKAQITIGSKLKLIAHALQETAPQDLMTGEVTALEVEVDGAGTFTIVRGYDAAHRLLRGTRSETYQQVTYSDIVKKVAQRNNLPTGTIDSTSTVHQLVSQANQTDWDFLRSLADAVGYHLGVENGKLGFTKPVKASTAPNGADGTQAQALELGSDVLRLRSTVTAAGQVPSVEVRGWDDGNQRAVVATVPVETSTAQIGVRPSELAGKFGAPAWVVTHVPHRTQATAEAAAKALAERVAGTFAELEGVCRGNPNLHAGTPVALSNLGAPFDGKYTLSRVRHVFDNDSGYTTHIAVTGQQDRSMLGLASSGSTARQGIATGIVTDVNDPQKLGRVKVRLPWMRDDFGTTWSRVLQAGAGADRGSMLLPEVNDEVLVAFEHGDISAPFVLGGLYSARNKPYGGQTPSVDSGSGAVNRRAFVGRTGHSLELLESQQKNGIWLHTGDGKLSLAMDGTQAPVITVHSDGKVVVEAKEGVDIDAGSGGVKITGGQNIELTAKTGISLDGGGGDVQVKGVNVDLNGQATCSIQAPLVKIN
ncbi:phage protein D [Kribbella antiqua]|uniref:Phage protein D n=1 Tax=Kribbella antiqua TaxID=2512217 RepID=A0A4R2IXT5_9ACTN|nr:VgrG-related protein [Kribbella antiqua]TCO50573.1 phage protein D [Kribbella antiqua]